MNNQLSPWTLIADSLQQNILVMLLYVLESKGSSPGRQGFFMAVNAEGEMEGSIGGGIMEHKFVEMAKENLLAISRDTDSTQGRVRKQVHDKAAVKDQSGMICSGEQTILLYPVKGKDSEAIQKIISSVASHKNGLLQLDPAGIHFSDNMPEKDFYFAMRGEDDWQYEEKTGYKNQLFIIGGGHCALAFSKLMCSMDFDIRIYDDRKDLKTMRQNEFAHEKHIVNDYSDLARLIPSGNNCYVVIMTFGYRTDDKALRSLLGKKFHYLGLLGSKSKVEKMFEGYRKEGINASFLQEVRTPIGLPIRSQTPEEIAVSIAAEIIQEKNKNIP